MYYGARYYDPLIGRFISADTIVPGAGNPQALNRYSYALNNPLKYIDPSGHCPAGPGGEECKWLERLVKDTYGVTFSTNFGENEIYKVLSALNDLAGKMGGINVIYHVWHDAYFVLWERGEDAVASKACSTPSSCQNKDTIHMLRSQLDLADIAHELGHLWDYRTRPSGLSDPVDKFHGGLWQGLAEATGSYWTMTCMDPKFCEYGLHTKWVLGPDSPGSVDSYARESAFEDWAMSFELWVTNDQNKAFFTYGSTINLQVRMDFVQERVNQLQRYR